MELKIVGKKDDSKRQGVLDQKRVINWRNCSFFFVMTAFAVIGCPIYIYNYGLAPAEIALFAFWATVTGMSITIGYHRFYAHKAFKVHPIIEYLVAFFGAGAFQESVLQWTSQHRQHHKYVDTEQDPYNIKQGFFYAHMGWLLYRRHNIDFSNVKDLSQKKFLAHQHEYYKYWGIVSGIILPTVVGGLLGHWVGGFLIGVAGRMTFVHHGTFMINSVCHYFGKSTFDRTASPRDHWIVALITNGEGFHSYHHRFPSDYRNGIKWYHWDPSKWAIAAMARIGLARDLKRASEFQIVSASLIAEREYVEHSLSRASQKLRETATAALKVRYEQVKEVLHQWELRAKEYAEIRKQGVQKSHDIRKTALLRVQEAREQFLKMRAQWAEVVERPLPLLAFSS
jgi:stearoyl-CoA desaturase (Delta-9 desaturase)